jgi:hypothetical protein
MSILPRVIIQYVTIAVACSIDVPCARCTKCMYAQMYECTNAWLHKCMVAQMYECTNARYAQITNKQNVENCENSLPKMLVCWKCERQDCKNTNDKVTRMQKSRKNYRVAENGSNRHRQIPNAATQDPVSLSGIIKSVCLYIWRSTGQLRLPENSKIRGFYISSTVILTLLFYFISIYWVLRYFFAAR